MKCFGFGRSKRRKDYGATTFETLGDEKHEYRNASLWLKVDARGDLTPTQADLGSLANDLELPWRQVELLQPQALRQLPIALLVRPLCILIALEGARLAVTATDAVLLSVPAGRRLNTCAAPTSDTAFVRGLQSALRLPAKAAPAEQEVLVDRRQPFELRVLEYALAAALHALAEETRALEAYAVPALEAIARKIASHRFKELYNIKKAASSLRARVGQFRQTLAAVLADDRKLAGMSLSLKAEARSEEAVADGAGEERGGSPRCGRQESAAGECAGPKTLLELVMLQVDALESSVGIMRQQAQDTQTTLELNIKIPRLDFLAM